MAALLRLSMVAAKLDSQACLSPHLLSPCLSHQLLEPPFLLENMANSQLQCSQYEISSGNEFILVLHLETTSAIANWGRTKKPRSILPWLNLEASNGEGGTRTCGELVSELLLAHAHEQLPLRFTHRGRSTGIHKLGQVAHGGIPGAGREPRPPLPAMNDLAYVHQDFWPQRNRGSGEQEPNS